MHDPIRAERLQRAHRAPVVTKFAVVVGFDDQAAGRATGSEPTRADGVTKRGLQTRANASTVDHQMQIETSSPRFRHRNGPYLRAGRSLAC
ncbi:MAG: hypothetical protein JWP07_3053 [Pseudonocardiales bacterium]|nr:hypothetical protein [Pseudonocardiales bacterium]